MSKIKKPSPQRVAAAGASLVSFAAMTVAMGPLTSQVADAAGNQTTENDPAGAALTTAQVPAAATDVVVEVIPNYVPVSEDGTPLPAGILSADGTLVTPTSTGIGQAPLALATEAIDPVAADSATPVTNAPAAVTTPTAAPATTAAPAPTTAPTATAAAPTTAPATAAAPAPTTAPATTTAPAPTAAPATTAAPAVPAAKNPPPPPKSDASG